MNTVAVRMSRDEWERVLPALQSGHAMLLNDAMGDKGDIDSAIASGMLGPEIRRLEALCTNVSVQIDPLGPLFDGAGGRMLDPWPTRSS